ncbi:kinase-like protein [Rhizoclosmatium globosum]|uniref:Kinase-like protein n=1 Tax=Rhizoclosmatium globosum TaxID=329046 RepID=A0A1Y2CNN1_9FUNG|nr:kinase-like protein [Rhizoclosmatium globosum]|eukprot:ORY48556.1 kinase-like protein [Rhizoclosmatium globosum]
MSKPETTGTTSVRAGMEIDGTRLAEYLATQFKSTTGLQFKPPLQIKQFQFGQSNPTYFITDANNNRFVLRKKPPGQLLSKTAHAVEREYRVISALYTKSDVPVPRVYVLCEDNAVVGTPFYVMQFLQGRIFEDNALPQLEQRDRESCLMALIQTLAKLHKTSIKDLNLETFSHNPTNFYSRQINTLSAISQSQHSSNPDKVAAIPRLNEMLAWFKRNMVPEEPVTIVHGDYKLDNVVYAPTENRVIGILDWELSTLGHPLSDLANCLLSWYTPAEFHGKLPGVSVFGKGVARPLSVPEVDVLLREYCKSVGRAYPIPRWEFCIAFSFFRLLVIIQGVTARAARKQASSANATVADNKMMEYCAGLVLQYVDKGDLDAAKL